MLILVQKKDGGSRKVTTNPSEQQSFYVPQNEMT